MGQIGEPQHEIIVIPATEPVFAPSEQPSSPIPTAPSPVAVPEPVLVPA